MTTQRTTKILTAAGLLAIVLGIAPLTAQAAGPFDGSVPLLCVAIDLMECAAGGECQKRTTEDVNLPRFLTVDFKGQSLVAADDSNRTAPIQRVERADGHLILQGGQGGRAWSIVIDEETGKLSAGVLDQQGTFSVFGACTTR